MIDAEISPGGWGSAGALYNKPTTTPNPKSGHRPSQVYSTLLKLAYSIDRSIYRDAFDTASHAYTANSIFQPVEPLSPQK